MIIPLSLAHIYLGLSSFKIPPPHGPLPLLDCFFSAKLSSVCHEESGSSAGYMTARVRFEVPGSLGSKLQQPEFGEPVIVRRICFFQSKITHK